MSRPGFDWRDAKVTRTQALRDLDAYAWAPRAANRGANIAAAFAMAFLVLVAAVRVGWL